MRTRSDQENLAITSLTFPQKVVQHNCYVREGDKNTKAKSCWDEERQYETFIWTGIVYSGAGCLDWTVQNTDARHHNNCYKWKNGVTEFTDPNY